MNNKIIEWVKLAGKIKDCVLKIYFRDRPTTAKILIFSLAQDKDGIINMLAGMGYYFQKLACDASDATIWLISTKDGLTIHIADYKTCDIIGYKDVKKKKTIETDEEETVQVPIFDCGEGLNLPVLDPVETSGEKIV